MVSHHGAADRSTPTRITQAVIAAFRALHFDFEEHVAPDGVQRTRGYANGAIVEVDVRRAATVSLLVDTSSRQPSVIFSAMCLATVSSVLNVDFTEWLSNLIRQRGLGQRWKATRIVGGNRVSAEYFGSGALLITVEPRSFRHVAWNSVPQSQ